MPRTASIERTTSESSIRLSLDLDGDGTSSISTTVPFYDHMLTAFAKHSLIDLQVEASGDTDIDAHHTVEDTAIALGLALQDALGDKAGVRRYGDATVPLDEALARAVVDLSGRPFLVHTGEPAGFELHRIGGHFTGSLVRHAFEAITLNARIKGETRAAVRTLNEFNVAGIVPGTRNLNKLDPEIKVDVAADNREVKLTAALNDSFGFGGQNTTLILSRWDA